MAAVVGLSWTWWPMSPLHAATNLTRQPLAISFTAVQPQMMSASSGCPPITIMRIGPGVLGIVSVTGGHAATYVRPRTLFGSPAAPALRAAIPAAATPAAARRLLLSMFMWLLSLLFPEADAVYD